jgi:general L-amino acid transport system permease protein
MTAETLLPPPRTRIGVIGWLRENLFSGVVSSVFTIVLAIAIGWVILQLGTWTLTEARWEVITNNLRLFLVGRYPGEETWRLWVAMLILSVLSGLSGAAYGQVARVLAITLSAIQLMLALLMLPAPIGFTAVAAYGFNAAVVWIAMAAAMRFPVPRRPLVAGWLISLPLTFYLLAGYAGTSLDSVSTNVWGGLLLTVLLALVGIILSFPMGVILALGRRSELPALRWLSTGYIELIRGVPLVTILFMADIILPLFLPGEWRLDRIARAMGGITLFSAAYVAENVRGGLQAIPSGQIEAARALGLSGLQTNTQIVLPQALRSVIPANVGLFISLLKDTSLVSIIGLTELVGIGNAVLAQSESFGASMEVYAFVAVVFFILCYAMSQASYRLERALGVGSR